MSRPLPIIFVVERWRGKFVLRNQLAFARLHPAARTAPTLGVESSATNRVMKSRKN